MDLYATLGLPRTATEAQIKKAYRNLSREYHPDRNPGNQEAEAKFIAVKLAYDVLSDQKRRSRYDQTGQYDDGVEGRDPVVVGAISYLRAAMMKAMVQISKVGERPKYVDLVERLRAMIDGEVAAIENNLKCNEQGLKLMAEVKGRYETEDDENILEGLNDMFIAGTKAENAELNRKMEFLSAAREMLAKYKFRVDPQEYTSRNLHSFIWIKPGTKTD